MRAKPAPALVTASSSRLGPNDQYKLFLKKSDYSTPWYVLAENIVGIKIWLEGEASDLD